MASEKSWQERYSDRFYRSRPGWIDGTTQYFEMVRRLLPPQAIVLELGSGPSNRFTEFLSKHSTAVDGLDVDPDAATNQHLRQFHQFQGGAWPFADAQYDAVVSNYVLEHVDDPAGMAAEAFRVLKPGGLVIFRTPNLWHYVSMVSYLSPHWFHNLVSNRLRNMPKEAHDPYPTYYRLNSRRAVRRVFGKAGFRECELTMIEKDPSYGHVSRILFLLFTAYERVVNSTELLSGFRSNILGAFQKPQTA